MFSMQLSKTEDKWAASQGVLQTAVDTFQQRAGDRHAVPHRHRTPHRLSPRGR